jgi:glutamine---fructose-6-phosphate transaminase (isomerizing)
VQKCLGYGGRLKGTEPGMVKLGGLDGDEQALINIENLLIAACGTSYYASNYGSQLMREFGCFQTVEVKIASEIFSSDFPQKNGGLLCVSQSGETTDLLKPFREAGELGLKRFNIVNNFESTLAREAKCGVFVNAGKELSIASTKAYIC